MTLKSRFGASFVKLNYMDLLKLESGFLRFTHNFRDKIYFSIYWLNMHSLNAIPWNRFQVGRDPRPVMREAYNMFKDGGDPEKVRLILSSFSVMDFIVFHT